MRRSSATETVPRLSWDDALAEIRREWKPGDHASVTAPTGWGKSFLVANGLLPLWRYVLAVDVKGDDENLVKWAEKTISSYPSRLDLYRDDGPTRFRVRPGGLGEGARHNLDQMFRAVWRAGSRRKAAGSWTIYLDEARLISDQMKLKAHLTTLWVAGRSKGITVIGSTQAPRFVPSEYYDQPTWHYIGGFRDKRTLVRMSEIGGDTDLIAEVVPSLSRERHEFLILGPATKAFPEGFSAVTSVR